MRITYKGDYALKTLLELAMNYQGDRQVITINVLARKLDIPLKFLEAVLLDLNKGSFVRSKRGKAGGYYLARPPAEISVADVLRYVDGPIEPIACVTDCYQGCKDVATCAMRDIWKKANQAVTQIVDSISLDSLVRDTRQKQAVHVYEI